MLIRNDKSNSQRLRRVYWLKLEGLNMAITDRIPEVLKPGSSGKQDTPTLSRRDFNEHYDSSATQSRLAAAEEKWNAWYGDSPARNGHEH
jgi:hypothetical protein